MIDNGATKTDNVLVVHNHVHPLIGDKDSLMMFMKC